MAANRRGWSRTALRRVGDGLLAPNFDCGPNNVQKLQDALDLAASTSDADRVLLGEATYVATSGPFHYTNTGVPVEIVGAGRGRSVLTAPDNSLVEVLALMAGSDSSLRDLTVRIPADAGNDFRGLHTDGVARRVDVIEAEHQTESRMGVLLGQNGTLEDSTVTLNTEQSTTGVVAFNPALNMMISLRGVAVTARRGVRSHGYLTIDRARVTGGDLGVLVDALDTKITNSLVRPPPPPGGAARSQARLARVPRAGGPGALREDRRRDRARPNYRPRSSA